MYMTYIYVLTVDEYIFRFTYVYHICSIYRIVYFMYRIYFILHINPLHRLFNLFMYNLQHAKICCTIHVIATPTCVATIPSVSSSIPSLIRTVFWQLSAIFSMDEEKLSDRNARLNKCHFGTHVDPVCVCVYCCVYLCDYPGTGLGWPAVTVPVTVADAHMVGVFIL